MGDVTSRVWAVFSEAMEIVDTEERAAHVSRSCGTDLRLRREVEELVQAAAQAGRFLPDQPGLVLGDQLARDGGHDAERLGAEQPGSRIDRYKLLQKLGEGGYGIVYLAEQ